MWVAVWRAALGRAPPRAGQGAKHREAGGWMRYPEAPQSTQKVPGWVRAELRILDREGTGCRKSQKAQQALRRRTRPAPRSPQNSTGIGSISITSLFVHQVTHFQGQSCPMARAAGVPVLCLHPSGPWMCTWWSREKVTMET